MASAEARKCPNCGAVVARLDARYCEFCGHELPRPAAPPPPTSPSPFGDVEARFAALQQHAELPRLMLQTPKMAGIGCGAVFAVVFFLVFIGIALTVYGGVSSMGAPSFLLLVPVVFIGAGVFAAVSVLRRIGGFNRAPLQREPALVTGERTEVYGGGHNSSSSTGYHITLEFPGGSRREFRTRGKVVGKVSDGDVGVAYLKGEFLLDFERLRV